MSVDETKNVIRQGIQAAEQAIKSLKQLASETKKTKALASSTTDDSKHEHVTTGLDRLTRASKEIEIVNGRLSGSRDGAKAYMDVLG